MEINKDVDSVKIVRLLYSHRKLFIINICIAVVLAIVFYVSIPKSYTTSSSLAPEFDNLSVGGLSSLASMAGVNLGNSSEGDAIGPDMYPNIVSSIPFQKEILETEVTFERDEKEISCTLYSYLVDYQKDTWLTYLISLPGKGIKFMRSMVKNSNVAASDTINPYKLTEEQFVISEMLDKCIEVEMEREVSLIDVNVTFQDAEVATQINEVVLQKLQEYVVNYRTNKTRKDLEASIKLRDEAMQKYQKAQDAYANYKDRHQNLLLQTYMSEQDRLENEMQLAFNSYSEMLMQVQRAKANLQERTPVFSVVQIPSIPLKATSPRLSFTLLSWLFMAIFGTALWVVFKPKYDAFVAEVKKKDEVAS